MDLPRFIAHRGASNVAPENTLIAFKLAKARGNTWLEFDVQLSADNIPVVLHDNTLNRTSNGKGLVYEHPLNYLKQLDAGSWFGGEFKNEPIPTLQETLALLETLQLSANIEIKDSPDLEQNKKTARIVCEFLKHYPEAPKRFLVSSFCFEALKVARSILPDQPLGMLLDIVDVQKDWEAQKHNITTLFQTLNCYSLNVNQNALTPDFIKTLQQLSPKILAYTVNQRSRAEALFSLGITGVFSDALA